MESSIVLFKAGCSIQRGIVLEGMFFRDFCLERGPFPIHMEVEKRTPPEALFKKQYRISPVESENFLALFLWSIWIFCNLIGWAPKSLQMVAAAMKLKDAYSLEEKL